MHWHQTIIPACSSIEDDLKPPTQCIWLFDYLTWQAVKQASLPGFALLNVSVTAINWLSVSCRTLLSIALVFFSFHVSAKWLSKALQKQAHTCNTIIGHTVIRLNGQSTLLQWTVHKSSVMACHISVWHKILPYFAMANCMYCFINFTCFEVDAYRRSRSTPSVTVNLLSDRAYS